MKQNQQRYLPDNISEMNDEIIIQFFSNKKGNIDPNRTRQAFLDKYPVVKEYLEKRYEEFHGYANTLKCIFAGLDTLPRCENCGKILVRADQRWCSVQCQLTDRAFIEQRNANIDYEAKSQKFRQTCQERYGVNAPAQNPEILAKMLDGRDHLAAAAKGRETVRKKYGVDSVFQLESVKRKAQETRLRNHPDDPLNHKQQEETMLERYGVKSALCNGDLRQKGRQTKLERYGDSDYVNAEATKATKQSRYGDANYNNPDKHRQTCLEKYGVEWFSQTSEFSKKRTKKYFWKGENFDSMPELAFYIYHLDRGNNIAHEPVQIPYECEGKTRIYVPDFLLDDQLIEIKGGNFFRNGKFVDLQTQQADARSMAKYQCMLDNEVEIITEYSDYMKYVKRTYGTDFLKRCRIPRVLTLEDIEYPSAVTVDSIPLIVERAQWRRLYQEELLRWDMNHNTLRLRLLNASSEQLRIESYDLTHLDILRGLGQLGLVKGYSRFNPKAFQQFLDKYGIESVYDPCAGWGERMLVAYAQGIPYLGVDINDALSCGYEELIKQYGMGQQHFVVADSSSYSPEGNYDAVFTCPPYFNQEIYSSQGAENLSHDEFLLWWRKTVANAMKGSPRYVAYQTNQSTKDALNSVAVDLGLVLIEEMDVPDEMHSVMPDTEQAYESIEVFSTNSLCDSQQSA